MVRIAICGVCGRMGKRIALIATRDRDVSITGATEVQGCSLVGVRLGDELKDNNLGTMISDSLRDSIKECDCVIDFTSPAASVENARVAMENNKAIVIGTTGFTSDQIRVLEEISEKIPVLLSPNMSVGVNVVFDVVENMARKLGTDYSVEVEETHHVHKKDKPSGTGKKLAEIIKFVRSDIGDINIKSIREGEVVGDHRIVFESEYDTIEVVHRAKTRDIFASGAVEAAKFIAGKPAGIYTMKDVLEAL